MCFVASDLSPNDLFREWRLMNCANCRLIKANCICSRVSDFFEENKALMINQDSFNRDGQALSRRFKAAFMALAMASGLLACSKPHDGAPGAPGRDSSPCLVTATANGAHIECPDGSSQNVTNGTPGANGVPGLQGPQGDIGAPGTDGSNGSQGPTGQDGVNGADATPVTVIQFCPSYGATFYPSNFPEQGLCIADKLYAVYWNGTQAFLALIPPGTYSSTSPQACTFTVGADCQVTQQ